MCSALLGFRIKHAAATSFAALLVLSSLCVGCGQPVPTPEPVAIRFAFPEAHAPRYETLVEEFRKDYAHIAVELVPRTWRQLQPLDHESYDVFQNRISPAANAARFADNGIIITLAPYVEEVESFDPAGFYPGIMEFCSLDGEPWCVPAGADPTVMYYNKDLFDQHQVSYPTIDWTWDDLLPMASAISDPDAGVWGYAFAAAGFDSMAFVRQYGGRLLDDWDTPTRTTFDDPLTVEALEWFADLIHEHHVSPTPREASRTLGGGVDAYSAVRMGVYAGAVGMWMGNLSERGGVEAEWKFRWGMVPVPRGERPATAAVLDAYFVTSQAEHPEACWAWVAFLSRHVPGQIAPVRRSVLESGAVEDELGEEVAAVLRAALEDAWLIVPGGFDFFRIRFRPYMNAMQHIFDGDLTVLEAMERAQEQAMK